MIESAKKEIQRLEVATKERGDVLQGNKAKAKLNESKMLNKQVVH